MPLLGWLLLQTHSPACARLSVFSLPALETALSHGLVLETEVLLAEAVYVLKVTLCSCGKKRRVGSRQYPTPWLP